MKKVIFFLGSILCASSLTAQVSIGANFLAGIPTGSWNDPAYVTTSFGAGLEANYALNDNLSVGVEFGLNAFAETDESLTTLTVIPAGLKGEYFLTKEGFRPFIGLGLGYYLVSQEVGDISIDVNGFGVSPRIGAAYSLSGAWNLVLNVNYNTVFGQKIGDIDVEDGTQFLGIGLGVRYGFGS